MGQYYHCARCNTIFEHVEGAWAKCRNCGARAVTQIEVTGRHG